MHFIGGIDEAGRGPLAGPVVAAVVVLRDGQILPGVRDSKKLSPQRRESLAEMIKTEAQFWAIASASVAEIDELNILHATMLAMRRTVDQLDAQLRQLQRKDFRLSRLRIDGNRCPELPAPYAALTQSLVGGDDKCPAIGAASILAKVARDQQMRELHDQFPEYGFAAHKGYPTAAHRRALQEHGVTAAHRMSFRPVREAAGVT